MRIEPEKFGAEPAAQRGHAAAEGKGDGKQPVDIDAERFRHPPVIHGGANLRADASPLECEPDSNDDQQSDDNEKNAVGAVLHKAEIDLASQFRRQLQWLTLRPDQDRERRHENKD